MNELQPTSPILLMHPHTGEALDLGAESARLAEWLDTVRDLERTIREQKTLVAAELHRRMDLAASWTLRDGEWEIRGESPDRTDYAVEELRKALSELVSRGEITQQAANAAVTEVISYRPAKRGINALLKLGGHIADAIKTCEMEKTQARRISLSRAKGGRREGREVSETRDAVPGARDS